MVKGRNILKWQREDGCPPITFWFLKKGTRNFKLNELPSKFIRSSPLYEVTLEKKNIEALWLFTIGDARALALMIILRKYIVWLNVSNGISQLGEKKMTRFPNFLKPCKF